MEFLLETAGKAFEGIVDDLLILVVEELCKWQFPIQVSAVNDELIRLVIGDHVMHGSTKYEESVVDKFKSNLLLMIFWLNIINYNS